MIICMSINFIIIHYGAMSKNSSGYEQERIRGRSVQPIELSEPKVRRVRCKNLPYKEGFCRPHKTAIVALA